jgi:hypothetical protein
MSGAAASVAGEFAELPIIMVTRSPSARTDARVEARRKRLYRQARRPLPECGSAPSRPKIKESRDAIRT